ncbi:MAG TPA: hypothetical protein VM204_07295, partial [Gaiellaceae bacterium]|nr:hypothetical protein [Gaiellaceae bacterium]
RAPGRGLVERALDQSPARRPSAAALAAELREATRTRRRPTPKASRRPSLGRPSLALPSLASPAAAPAAFARALPPAVAGVAAAAGASLLPFYPAWWSLGLGVAAAATTALTPRLGVALALAVPLFPLGNLALALALLWGALALGWLALTWRDPRAALALVAGPLLAPLGLLALVPLAVRPARDHVLRAAQAAGAVALAAVAAGARGAELPLGLGAPPTLGLAGTESPLEAARLLVLAAPPQLGLLAVVLAAAAVAVPLARTPWRIALLGAGLLGATLLVVPAAPALPVAAAAWLLCGVLAWENRSPLRLVREDGR